MEVFSYSSVKELDPIENRKSDGLFDQVTRLIFNHFKKKYFDSSITFQTLQTKEPYISSIFLG